MPNSISIGPYLALKVFENSSPTEKVSTTDRDMASRSEALLTQRLILTDLCCYIGSRHKCSFARRSKSSSPDNVRRIRSVTVNEMQTMISILETWDYSLYCDLSL